MMNCMKFGRILVVGVVAVAVACCTTAVHAEILNGTLDYTFESNVGTASLSYDNVTNTGTIFDLQLTSPGFLPDTSDMVFEMSLTDRDRQDIAPPQPFASIAELSEFLGGHNRFLAGSSPYSGSYWGITIALTADPNPTDFTTGLTVDNGLAWHKNGSWSNMVDVPEPASSVLMVMGAVALLLAACKKKGE